MNYGPSCHRRDDARIIAALGLLEVELPWDPLLDERANHQKAAQTLSCELKHKPNKLIGRRKGEGYTWVPVLQDETPEVAEGLARAMDDSVRPRNDATSLPAWLRPTSAQ